MRKQSEGKEMPISNIPGHTNLISTMNTQGSVNRTQDTNRSVNIPVESSGNSNDMLAYLQEKVPGLTLATGNALSVINDNKTNLLTINPDILTRMQGDPEKKAL